MGNCCPSVPYSGVSHRINPLLISEEDGEAEYGALEFGKVRK